VDVAKEIFSYSTSSKHCTWAFTPTFEPTSSERTYGEFMVAFWAELIEKEVGMPGRFICPFILGSDGESTFSVSVLCSVSAERVLAAARPISHNVLLCRSITFVTLLCY